MCEDSDYEIPCDDESESLTNSERLVLDITRAVDQLSAACRHAVDITPKPIDDPRVDGLHNCFNALRDDVRNLTHLIERQSLRITQLERLIENQQAQLKLQTDPVGFIGKLFKKKG